MRGGKLISQPVALDDRLQPVDVRRHRIVKRIAGTVNIPVRLFHVAEQGFQLSA